jgi:hypothetical protein
MLRPSFYILYCIYDTVFRTVSRETTEALRPDPHDNFSVLAAPELCLVCTVLANVYSARIKVYLYHYTQDIAQAIRQLLAAQKFLGGRYMLHGRVA